MAPRLPQRSRSANGICFVSQLNFSVVYWSHRKFSQSQWPFPLVIVLRGGDDKVTYIPNSNGLLRVNDFPQMIMEIASSSEEDNLHQMLLQAACLARLGNALRIDKSIPFIVNAIYIDNRLSAIWHFVYQPNDTTTQVYLYSFWRRVASKHFPVGFLHE